MSNILFVCTLVEGDPMAIKAALRTLERLDFPKRKYLIVGSAILEVLGIREANDLDVLVHQEIYDLLLLKGFMESVSRPGIIPIGGVDLCSPAVYPMDTFRNLRKRAEMHSGHPYMSLSDLLKWKEQKGREKDLADAELIKAYLAKIVHVQ